MASRIVSVYNTKTGKKQRVPEHWIGHPTLGPDLSLTPSKAGKGKRRTEAEPVVLPSDTPDTVTGTETN